MDGTDDIRDNLTVGQEILAKAFAGNMSRHFLWEVGKRDAAGPLYAQSLRDFWRDFWIWK